MEVIVDLQGFMRSINDFVPKEISILEVDGNLKPLTFFIKSPCTWKSLPAKFKTMNVWLERNYHGMNWNSGDIPYETAGTIIRTMLQRARTIYVKGFEKLQWLKKMMDLSVEIIDLEDLDCPSLQKLPKIPPACPHHSYDSKYNCANANVKSLKEWLIVYQALRNRGIF